jgi:hypothetical protein
MRTTINLEDANQDELLSASTIGDPRSSRGLDLPLGHLYKKKLYNEIFHNRSSSMSDMDIEKLCTKSDNMPKITEMKEK